jgi:hypothetical protein
MPANLGTTPPDKPSQSAGSNPDKSGFLASLLIRQRWIGKEAYFLTLTQSLRQLPAFGSREKGGKSLKKDKMVIKR